MIWPLYLITVCQNLVSNYVYGEFTQNLLIKMSVEYFPIVALKSYNTE